MLLNPTPPSCSSRPVPAREPARREHLPELESLRGIAITLVCLFHFQLLIGGAKVVERWQNPALVFVRAGHVGVDLFFVLSAFLLSLPFLAEADGARVDRRAYAVRRVRRIMPLYVTIVVLVTVLAAGTVADLAYGLPFLVFGQSFGLLPTPNTFFRLSSNVWWSLATEAQFYIVLPLLGLLVRSSHRRRLLELVLAAYAGLYLAIVGRVIHVPTLAHYTALHASVLGRGPVFLSGILAAFVYRRWGAILRAVLTRRRWVGDTAAIAVGVALWALLRPVADAGVEAEVGWRELWHVGSGLGFAAGMLLVLVAPLRLKPLVCNRMLSALGTISYSLYLVHIPIMIGALEATRRHPAWWRRLDDLGARSGFLVVFVIAACVCTATITYRLIERPFLLRPAPRG